MNKWQEDRNSGVNQNIRQQRENQRVGLFKQNRQKEKEKAYENGRKCDILLDNAREDEEKPKF